MTSIQAPERMVIKDYLPRPLYYSLVHWRHKRQHNRARRPKDEYSLHVFDENNCIFIHVPKTGGISVARALFGTKAGGHIRATYCKRIFGPFTYWRYFTFAFVRNPYTRLASAYYFLRQGGYSEKEKKWFEEHLGGFDSFHEFIREWVRPENIMTYNHFIPQTYFVCDEGDIAVDFVGRFEHLERDFSYVCERLGKDAELPHRNATKKKESYLDKYDEETAAVVAEVYAGDFEAFGYSKDLSSHV